MKPLEPLRPSSTSSGNEAFIRETHSEKLALMKLPATGAQRALIDLLEFKTRRRSPHESFATMSAVELAFHTQLTRSAVQEALTGLEQMGVVEISHSGSRKANGYRLTEWQRWPRRSKSSPRPTPNNRPAGQANYVGSNSPAQQAMNSPVEQAIASPAQQAIGRSLRKKEIKNLSKNREDERSSLGRRRGSGAIAGGAGDHPEVDVEDRARAIRNWWVDLTEQPADGETARQIAAFDIPLKELLAFLKREAESEARAGNPIRSVAWFLHPLCIPKLHRLQSEHHKRFSRRTDRSGGLQPLSNPLREWKARLGIPTTAEPGRR